MDISKYVVWFFIYGFMGWIWESCYCTCRSHHWENRGFLFGPIVPIYGFGAVAASVVFGEIDLSSIGNYTPLQVFLVCFFGSIVLEYSTSFILEKLFHATWWDYSNMPLNINGRVCFPYSVGFGVAGLLVVYVLFPFVKSCTNVSHPLIMQLLSLAFMLMLGMDLSLTLSALTSFARNFERIDKEINAQMEVFYTTLDGKVTEAKEERAESKAMRKALMEEKVASLMKTTGSFEHARLSQIREFKRNGSALELRHKAAEHLPKIHLIKRQHEESKSA